MESMKKDFLHIEAERHSYQESGNDDDDGLYEVDFADDASSPSVEIQDASGNDVFSPSPNRKKTNMEALYGSGIYL